MNPPSGAQFDIRCGDQVATAVEVGGGLRSYAVAGQPVLDGYDLDAICDGARCQTLVPWPNRVQDGSWSWNGTAQQLALTEPEQHNAIHGLVRWQRWSVVDHAPDRVVLRCVSAPQPGYPWELEVANAWSLDDNGLAAETTIINRSDTAAPIACGFHPYVTVGGSTINDAVLQVPADTRLPTGEQQIPTGREPVAGTPYDFREPRAIGDTRIDFTFTDLHRGDDGRFRLILSSPTDRRAVTVWLSDAFPYVELFTGDALPDPSRRRQGLGVEPMTVPPNALATGDALVTLDPGASWVGRWGVTPSH